MNENDRRTRLIGWLDIIFNDVQDLLLDSHIFWELQEIVRQNLRFKECSGLFTQWMASSFIQATAVGVRRQAKTDDDSISLRRFLAEVQKYPSLVSREHYMSLYAGREPWLIQIGEHDFDQVAGENAGHVPVALVEKQIQQLAQAVGAIEHYVDRRIAHYDKRGIARPTPTFEDLTESLKALESVVILYWRLLKGSSMTTVLPTIQFDWKEIFEFAWVPQARHDTDAVI